jgi:DNA-binding MarR family transcriptional regulator
VQRVRDTGDRRRVIVELNQARLAELMGVFGSLQGVFDGLLDGYTQEQLAAIIDYIARSTEMSRRAITKLSQAAADQKRSDEPQ